jgi:hypothetical protein
MKEHRSARWCIVAIICGFAVAASLISDTSWAASDKQTAGGGEVQPVEPGDKLIVRACPGIKLIDCMPAVNGQTKILCDPETIKWIKENCPDVLVVY